MKHALEFVWLGNSLLAWLIAAAAALTGFAVAYGVSVLFARRLRRRAERTGRTSAIAAAGLADATRTWLLLLISIVLALDMLSFDARIATAFRLITYALIGVQSALWINALLVAWLHRSARKSATRPGNPVMLGVLSWAIQFVVWVTLALVLLNASGVNITAFVASLGVGGVAVALALQNVLGDLFASVSIGLDKPFEVGEYIQFGDDAGTVIKVGIKSTRIRALSGEELAISNSILLKEKIHNFTRRHERRVLFTFRLPFDTPRDRLPKVTERVRAIIESQHPVRFDRGFMTGFGEYGLDFEFVYFVLDPAYATFVTAQQNINLAILDAFDELGIRCAIPARMMHAPEATDAQ